MSRLWQQRTGSVTIHFAGPVRVQYVGTVPFHFQTEELPSFELIISGILPELTGQLDLRHTILLTLQGTTGLLSGLILFNYFIDPWQPLTMGHVESFAAAELLTHSITDEVENAQEITREIRTEIEAGISVDNSYLIGIQHCRELDNWGNDSFRRAESIDFPVVQTGFRDMLPGDRWIDSSWQEGAPIPVVSCSGFQQSEPIDLVHRTSIRMGDSLEIALLETAGDARPIDLARGSRFRDGALLVELSVPFPTIIIPGPETKPRPLVFHFGCKVLPPLTFHFPRVCRGAFFIPIREWYRVIPECRLVRLPDRTEIDIESFSVSVDIGLSLHGLSASVLNRISFDRLAMTGTEVELSAQGYTWHFLISRLNGTRRFAEEGYALEGMSLARQLGRGQAVPRSYVATDAMTVQQLAEQELLYSGWILNWMAPTWLIPANTWSYERLTPLEAIQALADAAGAYVHAGQADQSLTVQPRYRILPWHLADEIPDVILPADPVTVLSFESEPREDYTGVYIHGTKAGRKSAHVTIANSGGLVAPDEPQTNALLTDYDGLLAFGARYLGDHQSATRWTLELPLTAANGDVPLLNIGQIIQFSGAGFQWRGIVESVKVAMQGVELTQTIEVVTYG